MVYRNALFVFCAVIFCLPSSDGFTQTSTKKIVQVLEERIAAFDEESVNAARTQIDIIDFNAFADGISGPANLAIKDVMAQNNRTGDYAKFEKMFDEILDKVSTDYILLARKHFLLSYLETYSQEELLAMDAFYKTEIGTAILEKTPQLQSKMSELGIYINSVVLPDAMRQIMNELKL